MHLNVLRAGALSGGPPGLSIRRNRSAFRGDVLWASAHRRV